MPNRKRVGWPKLMSSKRLASGATGILGPRLGEESAPYV